MPTAYHVVHYRKFSQGDGSHRSTLEDLCRAALGQTDATGHALWIRASDRLQDLGSIDGRQLLLNKVADLSSAVFGEICLAEAKGLQALLQLNKQQVALSDLTTAEVYELNERGAPQGSQFIRGMAYWLTIGDHVLFVKTSAMTADLLRSHLSWLLKDRCSVLGADSVVKLQAEFDKAVAPDIGDIRNLRVKGATNARMVINTDEGAADRTVRTAKTVADKFAEFSQAIPIIEAILGKARTKSLVDSLGPDEHLAVEAQVRVRGRRTEASKAKLREVANDLADLTDGEIRVQGKDGQTSNGDAILRTTMPFDLPHEGANLLDFNNVADQLQEVYSRFVRDGKIPK